MKQFLFEENAVFHRYLVNKDKISESLQAQNENQENIKLHTIQARNRSSQAHLCRLIKLQEDKSYWPLAIMKRVGFFNKNLKSKSFALQEFNVKNFSEVKTQFIALDYLKKAKRCLTLYQMVIQNPYRKGDQNFFYKYLGLKKNPDIQHACFFFQFCNGGDLNKLIEKKIDGLSQDDIIMYGAQILEGLNELNKKSIIHRDLRPCNIFIHNGQVKIGDFDSSFIDKISSYEDVKNGLDIDTSPPEIIQLASKSQSELISLGPQKLYAIQSKCDYYFLGMILFKMIYRKDYSKNLNGITLEYLIRQKITSGFSNDLLQIMKQCLQPSSQKRIDLNTLNERFKKIQYERYFRTTGKKCLYLSKDPLTLFQTVQNDQKQQSVVIDEQPFNYNNFMMEFDQQYNQSLTVRYCQIFKTKLKNYIIQNSNTNSKSISAKKSINNKHIWKIKSERQKQKRNFLISTEQFIENISIKAFYYDYLYKSILKIDIRQLETEEEKQIMRDNKKKLEKNLVLILMFLFQILGKAPFRRDKFYNENDLLYEGRNLFENLVSINNKANFFQSRLQMLQCQKDSSYELVKQFQNKNYTDDYSFQPIKASIYSLLQNLQANMKEMLTQTIMDLINSYYSSTKNVREIIFLLIICNQQHLQNMTKNQIVKLKQMTKQLISGRKKLTEQVEIFFKEFKHIYKVALAKSEKKMISYKSVHMPAIGSMKLTQPVEDISYISEI